MSGQTFSTLQTSVQNNVRRYPVEYLNELSNIINDAQDEICQRKRYWFLEAWNTFYQDISKPNFWEISLPQGASYSTITDDVFGVWWIDQANNAKPLEYMPYSQAIQLYYIPDGTKIPGMPETYSETTDYTGLNIYPVPITNVNIYVGWRAKSLPDWDGQSTTATNILVQQYYNVFLEWAIALSWKFIGMTARYQERLMFAEQLALKTLDREQVRKRWERIKTLPQRKDLSIPRQQQVSPFRTPPWVLP